MFLVTSATSAKIYRTCQSRSNKSTDWQRSS